MLTPRILDGTTTDDGRELELSQKGSDFFIRIDRFDLMSSRAHGSEEEMARLALKTRGHCPEPACLIGGLGMGFTLRACVDALNVLGGGSVTVAEVFKAVVTWNEGPLGHLAGRPLNDPRARVEIGDVYDQIGRHRDPYDVILLDVDNGPEALTLKSNQRLYRDRGLARLHDGLKTGGVLAVWSAGRDDRFTKRLQKAGFQAEAHRIRALSSGRGEWHTVFVAKAR